MWPEQPHVFTLEYAYEEAEAKFGRDPREYSIQTTKMVADKNGKLKELHTIQMEKVKNVWKHRDRNGIKKETGWQPDRFLLYDNPLFYGRTELPIKYRSTSRATSRPSLMKAVKWRVKWIDI